MSRRVALLVTTALLLSALPTAAQPSPPAACAPALPLAAGDWVRAAAGQPLNQRAEPGLSAQRVGQIPDGDIAWVLDGPTCADGYVWWHMRYDQRRGWSAEGDRDGSPWLLALPPPASDAVDQDDPVGCLAPPESYERIQFTPWAALNLRTLAMLDHAQSLYRAGGGLLDFRDAVMQGSYNPGGVAASFGTHDGGGAVDLSVRQPGTGEVQRDEVPLMIDALRRAGFAAWLRDANELHPGSVIHIHAIAIGDAELSEAARGQIDGEFGYLRGYNGLPQPEGASPLPDTFGALIVCAWMRDIGFSSLLSTAGA